MRLSAFLQRFPEVVREGSKNFLVACPAHADHSPSLLVGQAGDGRILLHCRAGCAKDAVLAALGLSLADLFSADGQPDRSAPKVSGPAAADGPDMPSIAALAMYATTCARWLQGDGAEAALDYLSARFGVDSATAERLGLGFDPGGGWYAGPLDFGPTYTSVPRLTIPFRDFQGRTVGLQGRALTEHRVRWAGPRNPEGRRWLRLAVFDSGAGLDTVVVTEGPGDALTMVAAGYDVVGLPGASVSAEVLAILAESLQGRRVVLAGDNDGAGQTFNRAVGEALSAAGIAAHLLDWSRAPQGAGDVTAWREMDPAGFPAAIAAAVDGAGPAAQPKARQEFNLTEVGWARRLRDRFATTEGDGVLYAEGLGFFTWNGAVWAPDRRGLVVRREAQEMLREVEEEALAILAEDHESTDGKRLLAGARRAQTSRVLDGILKETSPMVMVDAEAMDAHPSLLAVRNGTVDLSTGTLRPHARGDLLTRMVNLDYRPDAACPRWERFLEEVFPDAPDLPAYLRRLVGYGITGETSEQAFAILWGRGANGKSIFTDTLTEVFRAISVTTPFSTFEAKPNGGGIPNDLAALKGARLVFASEGEQGRSMAEATIKRVTGQDLISARFMREEFFEFRPTFLILLATNHRPRFKGQDEGLWRRVKMLPWSRYFAPEERDHYLGQTLRAEAEGILAWAVRGAVEWYANGLQDPATVRRATEGYRDASDALAGFWGTVLVPEPGSEVLGADAFHAYASWADDEGLSERETFTRRTFYEALEERGVNRKKGAKGQVLLGVALRHPERTAPVGNPRRS